MLELERLRVGEFEIEGSVTIEELEGHSEDKEWIDNHIITLEDVMKKYQRIDIPSKKIDLFLNGVRLDGYDVEDGVYKVYCNGTFLGSGVVYEAKVKRDIILNNG